MDMSSALLRRVLTLAACAVIPAVYAHDPSDPHANHHAAVAKTIRSTAEYVVPDVKLVRDDGKAVTLKQELSDGRPVVLNFIYTTCTSICPLSSQTLADLQDRLGAARDKVHMMSISIDPEEDTPARLREYSQKFGAGPEWQHYTGTREASLDVQRAFNAYRGGKMNHTPLTLVRMAPGNRWVRIDGFATADQLASELRPGIASR
jgi:protein SCO1/2